MLNTQYLHIVQLQLSLFAAQDNFYSLMATAFGDRLDQQQLQSLRQQWLSGDFSIIPDIEILSGGELGSANGAYAAELDRIFISSDFLAHASETAIAPVRHFMIATLILEEIGHRIDHLLNSGKDSAGDEGEIFSLLVNGYNLSSETIKALKAQDDHGIIMLQGKAIAIEKQFIDGTPNDDFLLGTIEDDGIYGRDGNDEMYGVDGNDYLYGGNGNDVMYGGNGNDEMYGNEGDDYFEGGSGNDYLDGGNGNNYLVGGDGNDIMYVGNDNDKIYGGNGDDYLDGGNGNDFLDGGNGNDFLDGQSGNDEMYGGDGNDEIDGGDGTDRIYGGDGDDDMFGGSSRDKIYGEQGNDNLYGGDSSDILDGGLGVDIMLGGPGNDTYFVDVTSDIVSENIYEGIDGIYSSFSYVLGSNIENLALTGTLNINGTGNILNNSISGNNGNNILSGGSGIDQLYGYEGNDTLRGDADNDFLFGWFGNDSLIGGDGNDLFYGDDGNDILIGGIGNDTLIGGNGNDIYIIDADVDLGLDSINDNSLSGTDTLDFRTTTTKALKVNLGLTTTQTVATGVQLKLDSFIQIIENIYGGSGNDTLIGDGLNNFLLGGSGNNRLDGGDGNDTLIGGSGNDTLSGGNGNDSMVGGVGNDLYGVNTTGDRVIENANEGIDTVNSAITYTLGTNLESLTLTGTTAINGTGNTLNNVITGNSGNNRLDGGDGNDTLIGGSGNDTLSGGNGNDSMVGGVGNDLYGVNTTGDRVIELANQGIDTVNSAITYTLGANLENLTLTGTTAINGTGNTLNNVITGNSGNNRLDGGDGNDTLIGGNGNDIMVGEAGNDVFRFSGTALTGVNTVATILGRDIISDFAVTFDKIALSKSTFTAITSAVGASISTNFAKVANDTLAATQTAGITYSESSGNLFYNQNGTAAGFGTNGGNFANLTGIPATLGVTNFVIVA